MTNDERQAVYEVCKVRGHQPTDEILLSNPPQRRCRYCRVTYWTETVLHEGNVPE